MSPSTFDISESLADRLRAFLESPHYRDVPKFAKSDYWQHHANQVNIEIRGSHVSVEGVSGYYIPPRRPSGTAALPAAARASMRRLRSMVRRVVKSRSIGASATWLLDYQEAFDRLMRHDLVAQVELSSQRVNYRDLAARPGVFPSVSSIRGDLFMLDRYVLETHLMRACYYHNLIVGFTGNDAGRTILEIGAGSGLLSAMMFRYLCPRLIIVDLPEVLPLSFLFLADLFPDASFRLPNEIEGSPSPDVDIAFLTPSLVDQLPKDSVDLAVNVESFQEMTHEQISGYFQLIQRVCRHGASFFTSNRIEKIPLDPSIWDEETTAPVNRFTEYPWNSANDVLMWEVCKLHRLTKLDPMYLRMERINK